jgi:hypothetical protein
MSSAYWPISSCSSIGDILDSAGFPASCLDSRFSEAQDHDIDLGLNLDVLRKLSAWKRIKRAARFQGQCPAEFVTRSILEIIRTLEGDMILSPRTGEAICDIAELEQFAKSES